MSTLKTNNIISVQERRLGTIGAYWGPANLLARAVLEHQAPQRIRTFSQTKLDEIVCALHLLHHISDAAVVVHGANGCSSVKHFLHVFDGDGGGLVSSNLSENDSIMGSDRKLGQAIEKAYHLYKPRIIFVVTTPIVAINNDDVQSVAGEFNEELDIPVVPVFTDGFKSRIGANGYDLVSYAIAGQLIPEAEETDKNLVNIIATTEGPSDIEQLASFASSLNLQPNIFPRFASLSNFQKSAQAAFSIGIRQESRILGEFLENERGIPFLHTLPPIGIKATSEWFLKLGELFNRQNEAASLVEAQLSRFQKEINELSLALAGLKVYISGNSNIALSLANLVQEFGAKLVGLSLSHFNQNDAEFIDGGYEKNGWDFNLHIAEGQPFEQVNIVLRAQPDIYLGEIGQGVPVAKLGIPALCYSLLPLYGYAAAINLADKIRLAIQNKSMLVRLSSGKSPYSKSWLEKSPNWYIKQEVK
jgi:nitrogenase molybdenum-iron protein alpha chain